MVVRRTIGVMSLGGRRRKRRRRGEKNKEKVCFALGGGKYDEEEGDLLLIHILCPLLEISRRVLLQF